MYFRFSDNTTPAPTDQTFSDLAEIRLWKRCFTIKKSTYSGYAYCIKTHILPYLNICSESRNVQKKFKTILKHCEMPDCNFHALRHGFATACLEKGIDCKTVSSILGHASTHTTMDIYMHTSLQQKQECIDAIG